MESTLPKYAPSISQLLFIPCIGHSRSHFLPLVLNRKQCWFAIVWVPFVLRLDYSFSINRDGSKRLAIVNLTPCHDLWKIAIRHFEDRFPPYVLTVVSQFNANTLFFNFLWLEFRFKSFLKLHVHFKGFMCLRMRKLHAECQIQADVHDWCQTVFSLNDLKFIPKL